MTEWLKRQYADATDKAEQMWLRASGLMSEDPCKETDLLQDEINNESEVHYKQRNTHSDFGLSHTHALYDGVNITW